MADLTALPPLLVSQARACVRAIQRHDPSYSFARFLAEAAESHLSLTARLYGTGGDWPTDPELERVELCAEASRG